MEKEGSSLMHSYIQMLTYMRPEGSQSQREFCKRFIEPYMGLPDRHGNYVHIVGDEPNLCFMAHHDTVHKKCGIQKVSVVPDELCFSDGDCLGADCTTGVYIILCMIEAKVPGVYVIHAAEEVGCHGSRALAASDPDWLRYVEACISFDRKGTSEIITHQLGERTCSDEFAWSLAEALNLPMEPSDKGAFTDSVEYKYLVPECTNVAVGYYQQHTQYEYQDLDFLDTLVEAVINADWSRIVIARDPSAFDTEWYEGQTFFEEKDPMLEIVKNNPMKIAQMLEDYGFDAYDLQQELNNHYRRKVG